MYELKKMERYLRVNLLGLGPRLIKKNLPGRGLTKFEKHCFKARHSSKKMFQPHINDNGPATPPPQRLNAV